MAAMCQHLTGRPKRRLAMAICTTVVAAVTVAIGPPSVSAAEQENGVIGAGSPEAVKGSYIVTLKKTNLKSNTSRGRALVSQYGGKVRRTFTHALNGYAVSLSEEKAEELAADPAVDRVYQDQKFRIAAEQADPPSWGLDRIDQRRLPLDQRYFSPDSGGSGVTIYVIDTGVRVTHSDFDGRARHGFDAVDSDEDATDGNGHGTHVATTAAGTDHGVAKKAEIVGVRVLNDDGAGTSAEVIAGIDWVTGNAERPAVANLSLGGGTDQALDKAVRNSIATGITYTVAAGNAGEDATGSSPARVAEAITVGATGSDDVRAEYSNYGRSLDLFAPGSKITAGWHDGDDATKSISGTSMASPHAAGAAALHLAENTEATPQEVVKALTESAVVTVVGDPGRGSPNRLLHIPEQAIFN